MFVFLCNSLFHSAFERVIHVVTFDHSCFLFPYNIPSWDSITKILKRFYYFIFGERGRVGEREEEKHRCARDTWIGCLSCAPYWGPGLQPRHVPWLGIKLETLWFTDQHSIHWASPARVFFPFSSQVPRGIMWKSRSSWSGFKRRKNEEQACS